MSSTPAVVSTLMTASRKEKAVDRGLRAAYREFHSNRCVLSANKHGGENLSPLSLFFYAFFHLLFHRCFLYRLLRFNFFDPDSTFLHGMCRTRAVHGSRDQCRTSKISPGSSRKPERVDSLAERCSVLSACYENRSRKGEEGGASGVLFHISGRRQASCELASPLRPQVEVERLARGSTAVYRIPSVIVPMITRGKKQAAA